MSEERRPDVDLLADYLEGLLPEDERLEVERAVAEDPPTAALLAELQALPALLSSAPTEPMPSHVAARIDAALAHEAARSVAPVRSLPRRRQRWLAPALVAAAAIAAIGIGAQVVQSVQGGGQSASSAGSDEAAPAAEEGGDAKRRVSADPLAAPAELSSASFEEDVARVFSGPVKSLRVAQLARDVNQTTAGHPGQAYSIVAGGCAVDLKASRVLPVRLDGEPALLVWRRIAGEPGKREALAYPASCPEPADGAVAVSALASATIAVR